MLGPLPYLHRLLLVITTVLVGVGLGVWVGVVPTIPVQVVPGTVVGILLGLSGAYLLLHDFHHRTPTRTRVRRRHH